MDRLVKILIDHCRINWFAIGFVIVLASCNNHDDNKSRKLDKIIGIHLDKSYLEYFPEGSKPYIITLPKFLRYFVAWIISSRREKTAQEIYSYLGDKSPILDETKAQADSLEKSLKNSLESDYKVFICMRHWHPMSDKVVEDD